MPIDSPQQPPARRLVFAFGPIKGVEWVTEHCLARFRERSGITGTAGEVLRRLEQWLEKSAEVELVPGQAMRKLFRHDCRVAKYWCFGSTRRGSGFVMVVMGNKLVTVHRNDSGDWRPYTSCR